MEGVSITKGSFAEGVAAAGGVATGGRGGQGSIVVFVSIHWIPTLFLYPVFALDKLLAPINVHSFGLLSSPSFDMGEVSREEEEKERCI